MVSLDDVSKYSVNELSVFLENELQGKVDFPDQTASIFEENKITGLMFLTLTPEELQELLPLIGERRIVKSIIDSLKEPTVTTNSRYGSMACSRTTDTDSDWLSKFSIPQFSKKTQQCIEKCQIAKGVRTEIISSIAWEIWRYTQYPSSEEYSAVCRLLVQKYPVLKDTIGNGFGSWKVQLRQRLKNMRRPADSGHKRARTENNNSTEILDEDTSLPSAKRKHTDHNQLDPSNNELANMEELESILQEENPDKKYVKRAMKNTYRARRKWLLEKCPPVSEILEKFPVLKCTKHIRRETLYILDDGKYPHDFDGARKNLDTLTIQIQKQVQLESKSSKITKDLIESLHMDEENQNLQDENTFTLLSHLVRPKTKDKIFHNILVDEGIDPNESIEIDLQKIKQNEPYIAKFQKDQYFIIIEREIVLECTQFLDAIINMICGYFTFDISYPTSLYPILIFIQRYILGIKDSQPIPSIVTRVLSGLDQHLLD